MRGKGNRKVWIREEGESVRRGRYVRKEAVGDERDVKEISQNRNGEGRISEGRA